MSPSGDRPVRVFCASKIRKGVKAAGGLGDVSSPSKKGGIFRRGRKTEESPDKKGHRTAESAGRGNLTPAVTENNRRKGVFGARDGKGENAR